MPGVDEETEAAYRFWQEVPSGIRDAKSISRRSGSYTNIY